MSETGQGQGWWQAADGKWYPPEQHPDYQPDATEAMTTVPTAPAPSPVGPPPGAPGASSNAKWIAVGLLAAAIVVIAAFLLLRSDDNKSKVAASSSSATSTTSASSSPSSSSSSSSRSSTSSSSSSSSSSSASSSSAPSEAAIKSRLLKPADIGPGFIDEKFQSGEGKPTACGGPSVKSQVSPDVDVGSSASNGTAFFEEEVLVFKSAADAKKALQLAKEGLNCPNPTIEGGPPASFSDPQDVSSDMGVPVDEAVRIDVQTEEANGSFFAIRRGNTIASFQFAAQRSADTSQLPDELKIVRLGLNRLAT